MSITDNGSVQCTSSRSPATASGTAKIRLINGLSGANTGLGTRTRGEFLRGTMKKELTDLGFDAPPEECVAAAGTARENLDLPKAERLRECGDLLSKALRKKDY